MCDFNEICHFNLTCGSETSGIKLTTSHTGRRRRIHPRVFEDLDEFASEGTYVLLDLVHVVFGDPFTLRFTLFDGNVTPDEISHDTLVPEVSF